jgi:hypothetical protein
MQGIQLVARNAPMTWHGGFPQFLVLAADALGGRDKHLGLRCLDRLGSGPDTCILWG